MLGNFSCFFFKKFFHEHYQVSNPLDPDQDLHFVGPDLGPNCLQRLSTDDKSRHLARVKAMKMRIFVQFSKDFSNSYCSKYQIIC